jgi:hypothetical protein
MVPNPFGGFGAWWNKTWSIFARNWWRLTLILVITSVLPALAFVAIAESLTHDPITVFELGDGTADVVFNRSAMTALVIAFVVYVVAAVFANAVGWVGGMWIVTRRAAGSTASLGAALAYGLRRCARVGGILLLVGLMVGVGAIACLVPGLYLAVASCLVVPFAIFDRGVNAIAGSFRAVHRNFGMVLGRVVVACLVNFGASFAVSLVANAIFGGFNEYGAADTGTTRPVAETIGSNIFVTVLAAPATAFLLIAILAVYAQARARAVPTTAVDLNAALGA